MGQEGAEQAALQCERRDGDVGDVWREAELVGR